MLSRQLFAATRLNALSRWHIVPSGHSNILKVASVALENIDYLPVEYCLDRGFHFMIVSGDYCDPNKVVPPKHLDIHQLL